MCVLAIANVYIQDSYPDPTYVLSGQSYNFSISVDRLPIYPGSYVEIYVDTFIQPSLVSQPAGARHLSSAASVQQLRQQRQQQQRMRTQSMPGDNDYTPLTASPQSVIFRYEDTTLEQWVTITADTYDEPFNTRYWSIMYYTLESSPAYLDYG